MDPSGDGVMDPGECSLRAMPYQLGGDVDFGVTVLVLYIYM